MSYIVAESHPEKSKGMVECWKAIPREQRLFRLFHNFPAPKVLKMRCPRLIPEVLVQLGHLRGLIYSAGKNGSGRANTYIHFMEEPPLLASSPEGTELYIVGGNYRVTERGIEG